MQNFLAQLHRVPAKLKNRQPFRCFHAKLAVRGFRGLDRLKENLQSQRGVFTAKNQLGSFQQRLTARFLLPELYRALRFVAHALPAFVSSAEPAAVSPPAE